MSQFGVDDKKEQALREKMKRLDIAEADIVEKFIHSGGKGGQNVNKTSTCVYLKHIPTGTEVKCQRERYQAINRFIARRMLTDKIERMLLGKQSEEEQLREKIRRNKRKRSKRSKEKMLNDKATQSRKKYSRSSQIDIDN